MRIHYLTNHDLKLLKREVIDRCLLIISDASWTNDTTFISPERVVEITRDAIAAQIRRLKDHL